MNFRELLCEAKAGGEAAAVQILTLYKPLLIRESIVAGVFDEDLYQEFCITLLNCIRLFPA